MCISQNTPGFKKKKISSDPGQDLNFTPGNDFSVGLNKCLGSQPPTETLGMFSFGVVESAL